MAEKVLVVIDCVVMMMVTAVHQVTISFASRLHSPITTYLLTQHLSFVPNLLLKFPNGDANVVRFA